jgi:hypothetical protein
MHSDKWRDRMRLDAAREEVARRAVADIETQRQRRADLLDAASKAGMQISKSQADDHPCADGRFPTYRDLTLDASDHLRGKWADEELLSLSVALMMQPIVAPFDIRADMDQRCKALELTLDRVRRPGGNLADRTFAEQVSESLRWAQKWMSDGKVPWGAVLIGSGLVVLAATGVGLAFVAPAGLAGAAVVTSTLAAFGPGGMVGGLLTLGTLTGTAASLTTLGLSTELDQDGSTETGQTAASAGADLAAAPPQALTVSLASMLAVAHAQAHLSLESTMSTVRTVVENALDSAVAEHTLHSELAPDKDGTKSWLRKVELIEKALRGLDHLADSTGSEQDIVEARRAIERGKPLAIEN